MKKIKDFSKTIGLVGRGGMFSPSNEISEAKWHKVFDALAIARGFDERPKSIPRDELDGFIGVARAAGFEVIMVERGINR